MRRLLIIFLTIYIVFFLSACNDNITENKVDVYIKGESEDVFYGTYFYTKDDIWSCIFNGGGGRESVDVEICVWIEEMKIVGANKHDGKLVYEFYSESLDKTYLFIYE